jgi:hypothetical protein
MTVRRVDVPPTAPWAAEQETVVDVRGDLLDMAEMHILILATVVAASFAHIWTIALGARICRSQCDSNRC